MSDNTEPVAIDTEPTAWEKSTRGRRSKAVYDRWATLFKRRRMKAFIDSFQPTDKIEILDVGGSPYYWELVDVKASIVLFNLPGSHRPIDSTARVSYVEGDGRDMPFEDGAFAIAFSNSVIEHVGDYPEQQRFASEMRRVGRGVYCQTPARWFPIEPHFLTPFIHYLPKRAQRLLLRNFTVWGLLGRPSTADVDHHLGGIRLLTYREMRALFPDCEVHRERFLGLTKSLIALRW